MSMRVIDEQIVYANPDPSYSTEVMSGTSLATIDKTGTEVLLCAFRKGSAKVSPDGRVVLRESRDGGSTWRSVASPLDASGAAVIAPVGGPLQVAGPHLGASRSGTMVLAAARMRIAAPGSPDRNPQAAGIVWADCLFTRHSAGAWSSVEIVSGRRTQDEWAIPCGTPVDLGGGKWFAPAERHARAVGDDWLRRYHAFSLVSTDDGLTWTDQGPMMNDPEQRVVYYDQHVSVLADGRLLSIAWVHDVVADRTLTARAGWSDDGGLTWSQPRDTGIPGGPVCSVPLPDGRVVAVYPHRGESPGVRACISRDGGKTWDLDEEFVIWDERSRAVVGRLATAAPDVDPDPLWDTMWAWTFGLPTPALLRDGTVGVAFYATGPDGASAVRFVRIGVDG